MKICDESDCPLHPDYVQIIDKEPASKIVNKDSKIDIIGNKDYFAQGKNSIKLETKYITTYIECLFCQHRKNIDMKKEIIVANAKQLLQE